MCLIYGKLHLISITTRWFNFRHFCSCILLPPFEFQYSKILAKYEGITGGISSGAVLAAAVEIHESKIMQKKNSVIIIPSFAERYLSTQLFNEF